MSGKDSEVILQLNVPTDLPTTPIGANYFHFTFVGPEFEMLVGNIGLRAFHDYRSAQRNDAAPAPLVPTVTHRFLLSPLGFAQLRQRVEEIGRKFDAMNPEKET